MKGKAFKETIFRGVVEGRITQFREIIKPQPIIDKTGNLLKYMNEYDRAYEDFKPRYKICEIVYLKEPYIQAIDKKNHCQYKFKTSENYNYTDGYCENKLTMPAKHARYFIKITGVRCEKLQGISRHDCEKEGIAPVWENGFVVGRSSKMDKITYETPSEAYVALIDRTKGKGTWDSNPFVFIYDFQLALK